MTEINLSIKTITLFKIEFDNLENRNGVTRRNLGVFISGGKKTALGKVEEFIDGLPPEKRYLGWDGKVYPIYYLEHDFLR